MNFFFSANTRGLSHGGRSSRRHKGADDFHTCDGRLKWAIKDGCNRKTETKRFLRRNISDFQPILKKDAISASGAPF